MPFSVADAASFSRVQNKVQKVGLSLPAYTLQTEAIDPRVQCTVTERFAAHLDMSFVDSSYGRTLTPLFCQSKGRPNRQLIPTPLL
jgi:hypothetical protein